MIRAGTLRHHVTVKRPTQGSGGSLGQPEGGDLIVYADLPCSIDEVAGGEADAANQANATKTFAVRCYTDPTKPIKATDYLEWNDGYLPTARKLEVAHAGGQPGLTADLVCGEIEQ